MFGENGGGDIISLFWDLPNGTRITNGTGYLLQNPTGAVAGAVKGCAATVGNSGGVLISKEGNNCVLRFTNPGVNTWTVPDGVTAADVLVVGGGGGAGFDAAGGGGGGAVVERLAQSMTPGTAFGVTVGKGGATSQAVGGQAEDGATSSFGTTTAVGGGGGGSKNANGRGVVGAGGGGGGHANPGSGGGITLGGSPSSGADSFWGWSASNASMVNNQGSVAQFSYIQASLTRTIPLNVNVTSNVTFNVSVDNSITNIIGWVGERIDTYSIRVELLAANGTVLNSQVFNGATKHGPEARSVSIPYAGTVASVRLTITGFDAGYWAGFYGPIFRNPSLTVNGAVFPPTTNISGFGGGGANGSRAVGNGGGGGGAGGVGGTSATSAGGVGILSSITNTYFGGGGGGGSWNSTGGPGGLGGGGTGGNGGGAVCGNNGAPNTGGGGGAMGNAVCSNRTLGAGGTGVVIVRYAAANANVELPPPSDYLIQYSEESPISWQTFNDGVSANESATVTSLTPGKRYIFRVASQNGVGPGSYTAASNMVEVRGAPGTAPALTSVTAGNQRAVVVFTAPTNIGGSPITRYTATAVASGTPVLPTKTCTWSTGALTCTIGELTNGREYSVTLTASNAFGTSAASASLTVTPKTTPDAPTAISATGSSTQLALTWSAPVNTGGSPITGYKIERSTLAAPTWVTAIANTASATTSATLTGLTNGTLYNIRITAINAVGEGALSDVATGTPRGAPSAPNAPTGDGSAASAFLTWSAPANNGAPITDYEIASATSNTGPWTSFVDDPTSATAATVTGLTNGTPYFFRVRAINAVGNGEWSAASLAITPATRPNAPQLTGVAPDVGQPGRLTLTFTAGATGGSPITGYEYSINAGTSWSALVGTSNLSISGLTNGVSYSVQIRAINAQGVSVASNPLAGAPTAPADPPVISGVVAGDGQLAISFSAPANNGGSAVTGYKYQIQVSGVWSSPFNVSNSPFTITGLNNAQFYSIRMLSSNSGGDGTWSASATGTPFTIPSTPVITGITPGNGSLALAYTVDTNGSEITALEYSLDDGANWIRSTAVTSPFVINGLVNGTSYTPQIRVINGAGSSPATIATSRTPFTRPFAPAITSVTSTPSSITLNFTVNTGGNPVSHISYRSRSVSASGVTSCSLSYATLNWSDNWGSWIEIPATNSISLSGLSTGNCYDIQVKAQNLAGYGGVSRDSGKPVAVPSAPELLTVTAGAGALTLTFNESTDNGGSAITAYEYRLGSGSWISLATLPGFTVGTSSAFTIGSLTNGTTYSITLRAVNGVGNSLASTAITGTPVTTPSAPTITSLSARDGALLVALAAPTTNGGSAILGYQYRLNTGNWITLPSSSAITSFTIPGLTNGTAYQVSLRAFNAQGLSPINTFATNVAPGTVPEAPAISAVIVGNQQISLVIAPGLDGGYPLDSYAYSINGGAWVPLVGAPDVALANPIIITGLTNGTNYRLRVRSANLLGDSAPSSEVSGTPATTPSAPAIVSISTNDGSLSVALTAPTSNGGSAISSYEYSVNGGTTWTRRISGGATSPLVINSLTNGVAYNVVIRAVNGIGIGLESAALTAIPQVPGAGRPISVTTTPLNESVRVAWAPPAAYVGAPIIGYRVNATPGSGSCSWSSGEYSCLVTGLTNGTSYTFTVTSLRDDNGTTRDIVTSIASATTTPRTLAGAPTALVAVGGGNEATLSWSAPASNGGAAISDYRIEYSSDSGAQWSAYSDLISADTTATVSGLRPGTFYQFRVAAVNAAGVGTFSSASTSVKTFEQAPELTLTLDQQTADGFSFILSFQDPILYTIAATANNPSATVEQVGDYFTIRGLTPGASVTVTITANRSDYLQAISTIFSSALLAAAAPTVSTATAIDGGFRISVNNYAAHTAAGISYALSTTAGAVVDDGAGQYRIIGLANGESAIATVTASRPGYVTRTTSVNGTALYLGVAAQVAGITGTRDGFTFTLANYSPETTYQFASTNTNAVISRNAELVTITGLTNLEVATVTVKTLREGYMEASTELIGVALPRSEVNTLSTISLSSGSIAFDIATYEYALNVANTVSTYRVTPTKSDIDSAITVAINGGAATALASGVQSAALSLNVGVNTIVIAVTSQVGSVQNYTLTINRAKSSVTTLSALSLSSGTITGLDSATTAYETSVPYLSSTITVTATPSNSGATMKIRANGATYTTLTSAIASGALALNVGNNMVNIEVTAEDGVTVATYEVVVTRSGAASSQLGGLAINIGTMPTFSSGTLNYEVIVPSGTTSAQVTPTLANGTLGTISVNGIDLASGAQSEAIALTAGATTAITILVTASDGSSSTPYTVNVKVDAPPVSLSLARFSAGTQSGVAFTTQPQLSINDAQGARVLLNTSAVSVAITSGAGGQLIGTTSATAVRGLATFTNLGLRGIAGTTYNLSYSSGGLVVATQSITLTPGDAVALAFRAGSTTSASASALAIPLQVAAVDGDGNIVPTSGSAITLTVSGNGALAGATVRTPTAGSVTFSDLTVRGTAGATYILTAESPGLTVATRNITLTFGAATTLAINRASVGPVSGTPFTTQPQIAIRDSAGNLVTNAVGEVSISIASGTGGTLNGTTTVSIVNGLATFTDLALSGVAGTTYTVAYSGTGVSSVSESLSLTAGAPNRVSILTPAAGFNNGTAFTRAQPILRIQDASGNTITNSTAAVMASVSLGGVLLGTTSQSASSGIVSFTNLGIYGIPGRAYTITFSAPGLTNATQTVLLTSGSSLVPTFGTVNPTSDGFTVPITNFNRLFNWTFSLLEGPENAQISLGASGLLTVSRIDVGASAIISATTSRTGYESGVATINGGSLLAPLRPLLSATTSTDTGFRAQVTNFDSSYIWRISASNGGTATISSTGLITVIDLNPGVSSDVTVTTSKTGRVSASATVTGTAMGADATSTNQDIASNLLTNVALFPLCAGGSSTNEGVGNLNDRKSKSKYLCFNSSSQLNTIFIRNSAGFYTANIGSKVVTGIQFTSGDSDRSRDPLIYTLFGCTTMNTDCTPIVVNGRTGIDILRNNTGAVQSFLNTVPYNFYKVTFGALRTSWTDAMQVAEVALVGTDAKAAGRIPTFGAVTRTANGFTVPITNFDSAFTWRASVNNNGGVAIGSDGTVTVTGVAGGTTATVAVTTSRPKYENASASVFGDALNAPLIPTFGSATPTADGFTVPITNYSADYTWSPSIATGSANIIGGVLTVTGQGPSVQGVVTVTTERATYATGRAQVVATALADGLMPTFGPSVATVDGFTIQVRNYSAAYTWSASSNVGTATMNGAGVITVTGLTPGAEATVNVSTSKSGSFTVIGQSTGKAQIGEGLTPRFALSISTADGFTAQILNYDGAYTWSGSAGAGQTVTISNSGLVTVTGATTGRVATATILAARAGYVTGSQSISGTAVAPDVKTVGGQDIQLQVPVSATTSPTEVIVTIDIPVDAAPGSTTFTGSAVATDAVDQGLRAVRFGGTNASAEVTNVSAPIAVTIPASAGIGIPVYSPDGLIWLELPLLAGPVLPEGQEMGYFRYDDGTIVILTRKIGGS
jgi:titin